MDVAFASSHVTLMDTCDSPNVTMATKTADFLTAGTLSEDTETCNLTVWTLMKQDFLKNICDSNYFASLLLIMDVRLDSIPSDHHFILEITLLWFDMVGLQIKFCVGPQFGQ